MPNARLLDGGSMAFTYSNFYPYQRITLTAYPFDWLEALYQYTDIATSLYSSVFEFSGNQTYKDKGFDVKIRLLKERENFPQIALGFKDIAGTGLFSSEYIAASKNFRNIDFSLGAGFGTLSGSSISNPLTRISNRFKNRSNFSDSGSLGGEISTSSFFRGENMGIFGGIEVFSKVFKGIRYKIEYDSTNYELEGFDPVEQDSKLNFGITYSNNENFKFSFSSIRGNEIQFGFSYSGNWSKRNVVINKSDKKNIVENANAYKSLSSREDRLMYLSTLRQLNKSKQPMRKMEISEDEVKISYSQNKYLSYPQSYGRVISVLDQILPDRIRDISLIPMNAGMELANIKINRDSFNQYSKSNDFMYTLKDISIRDSFNSSKDFKYVPKANYPATFFDYGLATQTHIGGPDRFFVAGLNLRLESEILINEGSNIQLFGRVGVYDAFDVIDNFSDSVLPHVRTDIAEYLQEGNEYSIVRFQYNNFKKLNKNNYFKFSAGIFEEMFAGYGIEFLHRPFYSNYAVGFELFEAFQRDYDQMFALRDYKTLTGFINFYYFEPYTRILANISGGRFLAKDSGLKFDFSREFKSGFRLGAFFSLTDISEEEFGEGSFDKGFYFVMPLEIFSREHNRELGSFGLRPVTRDGAAKMIVGHDLWGITDQASNVNIMKNIDDLYN